MYCNFKDIRDRITDEPVWWDEHGTPRYCEFSPDKTANIYRNECVLCTVACQNCGRRFRVAFSESAMRLVEPRPSLAELIDSRQLHYGDPPNDGCCPAGPSMNSVMIRVMQYWATPLGEFDLVRDHAREVCFDD